MLRLFAVALAMLEVAAAQAADWPVFGGNAARTGYSADSLPGGTLHLQWVVHASQPPVPAWPVSTRLGFDRVFQPVAAGGRVFFGSSADFQLHALDAATGRELWTFFTDGPVRFAPALWKDRVFAVSDDGYLYCLAAADGSLLWKKRGGPDAAMILGNDRVVSRWPARGGPVVADDVVYFGAGVWPSEGVYLYALDAATGKVLWCNDDSGSIFMGQPHGGANAISGVAAQGYLVVNDDQLLVPTGRAVPAAFDRETGKFRYFRLQANGHKGGAATFAMGPLFFNAGFTYNAATGDVLDPTGAGEVAAMPDGLVVASAKDVTAYRWIDKSKKEKGKLELLRYKGLQKEWSVPGVAGGAAVAVAGDSVVCGGDTSVTVIDARGRKAAWSASVDGPSRGLAVAGGRLFVSTEKGSLYCFAAEPRSQPTVVARKPAAASAKPEVAAAIDEIVKQGGVTEGYGVLLGCGDGTLPLELARRTALYLLAIDADPANVARARRNLDAAGLYGTRVVVHQGDPARTSYPRYFADLVVSTSSSTPLAKEIERLQRPFGGVALVGPAGTLTKSVRGPLAGAGSWTHQYADPANTCCSSDTQVGGALKMLWYRDSDLDGPSRHGRGPAPLFYEGRLFAEGLNALRAADAYNGRRLWEYELPGVLKHYNAEHLVGTAATQSNYCVGPDGLFVRVGTRCLRIDPATGKKLAELEAPQRSADRPAPWGYLAHENGLVFGSLSDTRHLVRYAYGKSDMSGLYSESTALFALDARTGAHRWTFDARDSLRHNAIAIGAGKVYLIDRPLAVKDRADGDKTAPHPSGELVALDAASGRVLWRKPQEAFGTTLALSTAHDVLLMSYQPTRFKLLSEIGGRLAAFKASTGERLWDSAATYVTRPVITDRTVYAQGGSWDLLTGESSPFLTKRSYGCGQITASASLLLFRSATLAYFDLASPRGVTDYGGLRPGCWINAIPAGGLVLVPDGTSGCKCSYLNQAWVALQPAAD